MEYAFLNVYAPSGSNNRNERAIFFSRELFRSINLYPGFTWIMGGDFNCVLSPMDVENGIGFDQKKCPQLSDLVHSMTFKDMFRFLYPRRREYTFFRPNSAFSRLDRFYVPSCLINHVHLVEHVPSLSDHHGIRLDISLDFHSVTNERPCKKQTY